MNFSPQVISSLRIIQHWDWKSVAALKFAFEQIRDSKSSVYARYIDDLMRELSTKTESAVLLPVHPRRIIAVDQDGYALTGHIGDLRIEKLPFNSSSVR